MSWSSPGESRRPPLQHGEISLVAEEPTAGAQGRGSKSIGVDINRNFSFLWRFDRHFAPNTVGSSFKPSDYESYVGPRPASESETRNVIWLLDRFPNIRYLVDLHSYGETILHNWGTDENQFDDPRINFRNPRYDGMRGRINDHVYREYLPAGDAKLATRMGKRMADAIRRVRGREYKVKQSVGLYPTAGASDDYAYSRHLVDRRKGKIIAYTMEWGRGRASTPFHPPYDEMRKVMREVTAGLLELCVSVAKETREESQRRLGDDGVDFAVAREIGRPALHLLLHTTLHAIAAVCLWHQADHGGSSGRLLTREKTLGLRWERYHQTRRRRSINPQTNSMSTAPTIAPINPAFWAGPYQPMACPR